MLECDVGTAEEADEIRVETAVGLVPHSVEWRVVLGGCESQPDINPLLNQANCAPFEDKLPMAAALFPCTSTLGELVNGMSTSQIPISSNCGLRSSNTLSTTAHAPASLRNRGSASPYSPLRAKTATHAVISLCTANGTVRTRSLIRSTAPASTMAPLFLSLLAARFRSVEMAWHWTSSFSSKLRSSIRGCRKPESMMGDSFAGWIETLRTQAAAERMRGR
jgi:hypothetical protein